MFKLFALTLLGILSYHDYQTDKNQHIKAKITNSIILVVFTLMYSESFRYILWMTRNFDKARARWAVPIGFISGELHFMINLIQSITATLLMYFLFTTIKRKESGRIWAMRLIPVLAFTETIAFYRGWISEGNDSFTDRFLAITIGCGIFGSLSIAIINIYKSIYMDDFFNRRNLKQEEGKTDYNNQ
ncbi:MAG: hypothetical protein J7604_09205 [Sporocytophaga sp.]|uniref:hypothetical protein n=1 Tax=Sporocytophaga sp. TaxID=2231183 RepID=UPI001B174A69|nr:hypothetical protein [Sporocytophaga sp.]MBO9700372.1 hypothetical protein [Sporocytophaga sp.]